MAGRDAAFCRAVPAGVSCHAFLPPAAWKFGRPVATVPLLAAHIGSLLEDLARQPALMTKIRPNPLDASIWREAAPAGWILLPGMALGIDLAAQTYANYLLQSLAIKAACEAGCSHYHMGESGNSKPIARFSPHFGGIPMPYTEFLFERLPISRADQFARSLLKRAIGFRDA